MVFIFGKRDGQVVRRLREGFRGPVEDFGEELDRIDGLVTVLPCQGGQLGLDLHRPLPVHEHALPDQDSRRHDEADRANLAEPFAVGEEFGGDGSHGVALLYPWFVGPGVLKSRGPGVLESWTRSN